VTRGGPASGGFHRRLVIRGRHGVLRDHDRVHPLQALPAAKLHFRSLVPDRRDRRLAHAPLRQQRHGPAIAAVEGHQQSCCLPWMPGPADVQEDEWRPVWLWPVWLRYHRPDPELRPVEGGDRVRLIQFVGERVGVQVPDVYQAGGPDQPRGNEQDHARERGRDYHTTTLSGEGPPCHHALACGAHGWRMDRRLARMEVVNAAVLPGRRGLHGVVWTLTKGATVSGSARVIVGVSGSPGSLPALRYAENLARRDDASLLAVHAWIPPGGDIAERRCPSSHLRQIWAQAALERLMAALDAAWGGIPAGLDLQRIVVRGETGPALVDLADSADDVLVLGTGRRRRLARAWSGRVSRYCVAHAVCPVVTVPPPALARRGLRSWSFRHRELTLDHALGAWEGEKLGRDPR